MIFILIEKTLFDSYPIAIKASIVNSSTSADYLGFPQYSLSGVNFYIVESTIEMAMQTDLKYFSFFSNKELQKILNSGIYSSNNVTNNYDISGKEIHKVDTFSSKKAEGKSLFKRIHGVISNLVAGSNVIDFSIPYAIAKLSGVEIINGAFKDIVDLTVHDDAIGTYSGIPFYKLNQFGYTVNVAPNMYSHLSKYDSDIFVGMIIRFTYNTEVTNTIGINYILNELK